MAGRIVTGRLAPSPTGGLHLGHARTFLIAWWSARASGGRVVFRVEDLDRTRVRPGMAEMAMADLRWMGIDWDEGPDVGGPAGPYVQSERMDLYLAALGRLKEAGLVYPCTCTRADIARAASAPHQGEEGPVYPGTCAGRGVGDAAGLEAEGRAFAWRFRVGGEAVAWDDRVRGRVEFGGEGMGGDFVVGRSDGGAAYQLAVVVDDAAMGVTEVVRGDDLVPSTPRQILLYRALGHQPPSFAHVGLAVGPDGKRMAKRDGALKLATLRERGVAPGRLVAAIAGSCGLRGDEPDPRDWVDGFRVEGLRSGEWRVEWDALGDDCVDPR